MNKIKHLTKITWIAVVVLGIVNLFSSNNLAVKSYELGKIEQQIKLLEVSSRQIELAITTETQLEKMEKLAQEQGYTRQVEVIYPDIAVSLALKP
jgi:hypothetical protein